MGASGAALHGPRGKKTKLQRPRCRPLGLGGRRKRGRNALLPSFPPAAAPSGRAAPGALERGRDRPSRLRRPRGSRSGARGFGGRRYGPTGPVSQSVRAREAQGPHDL